LQIQFVGGIISFKTPAASVKDWPDNSEKTVYSVWWPFLYSPWISTHWAIHELHWLQSI